jgi:hypothetical protein
MGISMKPWKLTYTVMGRNGSKPVFEQFATRKELEDTARLLGLKHYEVWRRFSDKEGEQ